MRIETGPRPILAALALASASILGPGPVARPAVAAADDRPASAEKGRDLLKEGDGLADKADTTEAVIRYKQAFEQLLPGLRKLPFKAEVKRDVTAREDLRALLLKELDEDQTPAEMRTTELAYKAFDLIPRPMDLRDTFVKVYAEEIAAFYDPKTKTMHLIREPKAEPKKASFLESLLGIKKGGFDKDENKTVIAHELTHALADQHFDLKAMQDSITGDDDRSTALAALIEGEATLAMIGSQMEDWDGSKTVAFPAADLDRLFSLMMPFMSLAGGASLRDAPPILSEGMTFPYLRGMVFCARLANDGGWSAVNDAYRNPPQSTEQVLHPEKYRAQPDPPTVIDLPKLEPGAGWSEVGRNNLGEFQVAVMLRRHGGKAAAAGWDGDRFAIFEGPGGKLGLAWATTWDTADDAAEFARNYARYRASKSGGPDEPPPGAADSARFEKDGATYAVERRGMDVAVVEGFDAETTARLIDAAFRSSKAEMAPPPAANPAK